MPRFKIAALIAWGFTAWFLANGQTRAAVPSLPAWLSAFPSAQNEQTNGTTDIESSYRVSRAPAAVIEHYRQQLLKAEVQFNVSFDGIGTVIRCSEGKASCVIQVRENDDGTSVRVSYSPTAGSSVGVIASASPVNESSTPVSPAPTSPKPAEQPGKHQIEYIIEGTAGAAGLTYRNAGGGTEQNDVVLPTTLRFTTIAGAFVSISAQKKGKVGVVRVSIKVDGIVMRQSTSSAPFGIASASGRVVDRQIIY